MKYYFISLLFLFNHFFVLGQQCNLPQIDHLICDITTLDVDEDSRADGILDLNEVFTDATGNTPLAGSFWSTTPELRFRLSETTGHVNVWDLPNVNDTTNENSYIFTLNNSNCGSDNVVDVRLILAPFSGIALEPSGTNNVNLEVCENQFIEVPVNSGNFINAFDLFSTLTVDEENPAPHLNGTWFLIETDLSGNEIITELDDSIRMIEDVPDFPNMLIDNVIADYRYRVETDLTDCPSMFRETDVRVSIVRQVFAGRSQSPGICESEILAGDFDAANLNDDFFLVDEDENGDWESLNNNLIDNVAVSVVNFREVYDELVIDTDNKRFGQIDLTFDYTVRKRSGVCENDIEEVTVSIYEELRPFFQNNNNNRFCDEGSITEVQLFDFIEFTVEGDDTFIYPNGSSATQWVYEDGPRDESGGLVPVEFLSEGLLSFLTPNLSDDPENFIPVGIYTFRYLVDPCINATGNGCNSPCDSESTLVTIEILPLSYAGENTAITICSSIGTINLIDQLNADPLEGAIVRTGTWRDRNDNIISQDFVVPISRIEDQQFQFTYSTITADGCEDSAILTINAGASPNAGVANPPTICGETFPIILFNELSSDPDPTGIWTGPNGFVSTDHFGIIENEEVLLPGTYIYTVEGAGVCAGTFDTEELTINKRANLGDDFIEEVCSSLGAINLFDTLGPLANKSGTFIDENATGLLDSTGLFDIATLASGDYLFTYSVDDNLPCDDGELVLTVRVSRDDEFPNSGTDGTTTVCSNNRTLNLFDVLSGTPETTGIWTGPFGYTSPSHLGQFIEGDLALQVLQPGIYTYTIIGKNGCGDLQSQSQVTVDFVDPPFLEEDFTETFCFEVSSVNLFDLLDRNTDRGGRFEVINTEDEAFLSNNGMLNFSAIEQDRTFPITYTLPSTEFCDENSLTTTIQIIKVQEPDRPLDTYCILDAATLSDVEIGSTDVWFETLIADRPFTQDPVLTDGLTLFLEKQERGCVSERIEVMFKILNIGEVNEENGVVDCTIDFQDVVTPNGDMINDFFTLNIKEEGILGKSFNIPGAFPNYELNIYNRYGVLVYEGSGNKAEFDGESNVNSSVGDLTTGVYFYVFNPNFENNQPIQGSFYLSK